MSAQQLILEAEAHLAALHVLAGVEEAAAEAKEAYRSDPSDPDLKAAHRAASEELNQARSAVKGHGPVGGDAFKTNEGDA